MQIEGNGNPFVPFENALETRIILWQPLVIKPYYERIKKMENLLEFKTKWIFIFKAYWFIDAHNYVKNSVVRHCWSYYWFVLVGILNDLASEANIDTSQLSGQSNKTKQKNLQNLILKPCYFYFIILGFTQGKSFSLRT